MLQAGDSVDTQDSNLTALGNKFRDSFQQDVYDSHDIPPPPPPPLMHQSTMDTLQLDSEPRSPPPRSPRSMPHTPLDSMYQHAGFDEDIPPPDGTVHLIDFEDGERDDDDDIYKSRTPSPPPSMGRLLSRSPSASLPHHSSLPPPPPDMGMTPGDSELSLRHTPSVAGTLSRHSSRPSIPAPSPKPPSVDFGVQVEYAGSSPTGSHSGGLDAADRGRPSSSTSAERRPPPRGRLSRTQTRDTETEDPDDTTISLGSDELKSTRV